MGEKLHERLKEVLKVNNSQVNSANEVNAKADGSKKGMVDGTAGLPENLLDKNFHEEMEYLASQPLGKGEEVQKESHFFKTMSRAKHNLVFR